ncbi:uncharacterized protein LOC112555905 [Pomacea canaliculata]|uniref:uncharacterized protein LOC112555905 n=1 Tax=Pomacea canaliculata TaxID=400727 RepID=UPI000D7377FA|nr:uncharacterized protein LOC112555905 [Pomacea canaliculata]
MNTTTCVSASCVFAPRDHPGDILSYKVYLTVLFVLQCVIEPVVVVVGVPSNIISCVVFWRQGLGDRMNVCLLALSLVDLCLLLVSMVFSVVYYLGQVDPVKYGGLYDLLLASFTGVCLGFRSASGCITMVIAIERCLCVLFPLKAASLISSFNMAVIMVCIVCLNHLAFLVVPAKFKVVRVNNSSSETAISLSDFYINAGLFVDILENIVMMSVLPLTTFVVTCLSTCLTVVKLRAAMTWRGQTSSSNEKGQGRHTTLTKMLVIVSCVYILTTIPWVVFFVAMLVVDGFSSRGRYYNFYWASAQIAIYLSYMNCSLGFYVYFNRSTRFRRDVFTLFGC